MDNECVNHSSTAYMKHHCDVLGRNYSKTEIPEDGISGCRNA